ncbi:P2Y purinoceptor 14-like [Hypanus sabinus]|uniref:P2Y purinoceptor 14-like n=1 Tax=Hypanus sabinus TaxID=79690 RepID=UPI0028C3B83B|nr:P2Y purinoceptor 14-like [Hypanus sabinus]
MEFLKQVDPAPNGTTAENGTTNCNFTSQSFVTFQMIAYIIICVIGIFLNGLAFYVYFCHIPSTKNIIIYLKNLVIADSLLVLSLPIKILRASKPSLHLSRIYCGFTASFFYLNVYSSVLFLGFIAATRYLKIVRPLSSHAFQNLRTAKRLSLVTWGILLLVGLLFVILINKGNNQQRSDPQICLKVGKEQNAIYLFAHLAGLVTFFLVLAGVGYCYSQISNQLHTSTFLHSVKTQAKAKNNILILLAVFFICFVPYHIVKLPYLLSQTDFITDCYWQKFLFNANEFCLLLSTLNACFDPVIYFLFCKAFRAKLGLDTKVQEPNEISAPDNASHQQQEAMHSVPI